MHKQLFNRTFKIKRKFMTTVFNQSLTKESDEYFSPPAVLEPHPLWKSEPERSKQQEMQLD